MASYRLQNIKESIEKHWKKTTDTKTEQVKKPGPKLFEKGKKRNQNSFRISTE